MKAYLHDEKTNGVILKVCRAAGVDILTPTDIRRRKTMPEGYNLFLDQVDALIMEITRPTQEMHFILAQAILVDKPALCVYGKNQTPKELLSYIKQKNAPRSIKTFSYTEKTLSGAVQHFIEAHDPAAQLFADLPSIKFTLRLSPRIERYLEWYAATCGIAKADYIRELLDNEVKKNKKYSVGEE